MDELITGVQLSKELGVNKATLALLTDCGVLHPRPVGTALIYDAEGVARLRAAKLNPVPTDAPEAWVVRLSRPREEEVDGSVHPLGWSEGREGNVDAARMYWRIVRPEDAKNQALVAVVGPLVVGVWKIDDGIFHPEIKRAEFLVSTPTDEQRSAYLGNKGSGGRWLALSAGPSVMRWPASLQTTRKRA